MRIGMPHIGGPNPSASGGTDGRLWESMVPDSLCAQGIFRAASALSGQRSRAPREPGPLRRGPS